ncbi:DUF4349 domain-containing protein [Streptomyces sp. NPDC048275]|uniref:DUF4349 domain-containing protein n=1 Tax=Streptomyces sp. NPDC048275 TaxID=3155629 RepID=UPI0033D36249
MRIRHSVRPVQVLAGIFLASALVLTGCSGANDSGGSSSDAAAEAAGDSKADLQEGAGDGGKGSAAKPTTAPELTASHIIRTASLTVQVKDVPKALDQARTTIENAGGYVGNETTTLDEEGSESTTVVLRVPAEKYGDVLADLEGAGKLIDREAKAQDVTDQVVDVDSRIASQRASVNRIRELMDQATKLTDVVTLEGELSRRQADLESLLARQASLKDRTSLAKITLSLSESPVKKTDKDDDPGFLDALAGGWDAFVTMLRWIVVALGAVLPFAALAALLVFVWWRVVRARRELHRVPAVAGPAPTTGTPSVSGLPTAPPVQREEGEQD